MGVKSVLPLSKLTIDKKSSFFSAYVYLHGYTQIPDRGGHPMGQVGLKMKKLPKLCVAGGDPPAQIDFDTSYFEGKSEQMPNCFFSKNPKLWLVE